jgi:hypothetical protein
MNQVILLIVTVVTTWAEGATSGNEQRYLLDYAQISHELWQARVAVAQMRDWSADLLQAPTALPSFSNLVEFPELSLKTPQLHAASDIGQAGEASGSTFNKASEKVKKIKKPSDEEFANLSFKEPKEVKPWRKPLGWTLVGVGSAAIIAGGGCLAGWLLEDGKTTPDNDKIDKLKISTIVLGSAGAVILLTGVAFLLWEEYAPIRTSVAFGPGFTGMSVSGSF